MKVLALDVGSSSVKAAVVANGRIVGHPARAAFPTLYSPGRAEVDPLAVIAAIRKAVVQLTSISRIDIVALCAMAPSWLAMDKRGNPITPVVTHQDRRSVAIAADLERRVGPARLLRISGNRPFPGGISSTTAGWFCRNHPSRMRKADLVGHLNTFLLRRWTGERVTDPSNASFMGVFRTTTLGGWDPMLLEAVGLKGSQLPQVIPADRVAGTLLASGTRDLGLPIGTPILPGIMDTSAAVLLRDARPGMLFNVSGSTDVLALCVDKPKPHARLLTRAVGVGRRWMAVSTIASAGTTLTWLWQTLFPDLSERDFYVLAGKSIRKPRETSVRFDPYLAGDRMSIDQKQGTFMGLTLSTTREDMLCAALDSMAKASGERIPLFQSVYGRLLRTVLVAGGVGVALAEVLHRDWPGTWHFETEEEATLRGLARLACCGRN